MNHLRTLTVATLLMFFAAVAWSQDQPREEPKPQQQEETKPSKEEKEMKPPNGEKRDADRPQQEVRPSKEEHGEQGKKNEAAQNEQHARPAGKSARIPDEKFKASFGRQHSFTVTRVTQERTIVAGQTQFVYGGYSFVIMDAWPTGWLVSDDCFIDYVDGEYFLFDLLHPGVRIALFVVE